MCLSSSFHPFYYFCVFLKILIPACMPYGRTTRMAVCVTVSKAFVISSEDQLSWVRILSQPRCFFSLHPAHASLQCRDVVFLVFADLSLTPRPIIIVILFARLVLSTGITITKLQSSTTTDVNTVILSSLFSNIEPA